MFLTPRVSSSRFPLISTQSASAFSPPSHHDLRHVIRSASMDRHGAFPYDWPLPVSSEMGREHHRTQQDAETVRHLDVTRSLYGSTEADDWYTQQPPVPQGNHFQQHHSARERHLPPARASPYARPRAPQPQAAPYHQESYHGPFVENTSRHRRDDYRPPEEHLHHHRLIPTSPIYSPASLVASSSPFQFSAPPRLSNQYEADKTSTVLREPLPHYEADAWHNERPSYRHMNPPRSVAPPQPDAVAAPPSPQLTPSNEALPLAEAPDLSLVGQLCAKRNCYRQACPLYGDFCEFHKPSRLCKVPECRKCAKTGGYCISHGGGRRCQSAGCTKSAKEGGFCIAHGGGKRCRTPGCDKAASSTSVFCVTHNA